ncbi:unnamed protein product [Calypogeia fissa]
MANYGARRALLQQPSLPPTPAPVPGIASAVASPTTKGKMSAMSIIFIAVLVFCALLIIIGYARYYYLTRYLLQPKAATDKAKAADPHPEAETEEEEEEE